MNNGRFNMPFEERQLFWQNLEKIKNVLLFDDIQFTKFIGIGILEYSKCRNTLNYLPLDCVYELAEKLNFHFMDLFTPDFKLLYNCNDQATLERYTIAPYSKLTPTLNIISYLEKTRGTRAKINLLRKLQLSENFLNNDQSRTNIHLISDTTHYLADTYNFGDHEFVSMGQQTPFSPVGKLIQDKLRGPEKDVEDLLETFVYECCHYFDKNCDYKILELSNDFAIFDSIPKKDVLEELKVNQSEFGNEEVCLTKMGCLSSFTWFQYNQYAPVQKLKSAYDGNDTNQYIIDLTPFKNPSRYPSATILDFKAISH